MGLRGKASGLMTGCSARASLRGSPLVALVLLSAAIFVSPAAANAAEVSVPATSTTVTTVTIEGYDVDFTLPTAAKNGCLVCHGDPGLSRLKDGEYVSFYVDPTLVESSAHAGIQCTGCHLDFAYTVPHPAAEENWQLTAKTACKNCHQDQSLAYGRGSHRIESGDATPNAEGIFKPLCGDCHGSHDILMLTDNPEGQAALHGRGYQVCGSCHQEYWDNANDYYHGAAYQDGAEDAPACWACHGGHEVLPSSDTDASTNERHLVETCSQCHSDANEEYASYSAMIHGRAEISSEVFLYDWYAWVRDSISRLFGG